MIDLKKFFIPSGGRPVSSPSSYGKPVTNPVAPVAPPFNPYEKMVREFYEASKVKFISLSTGDPITTSDDPRRLTDTKFGGIPYWPKGKHYPTNADDEPLMLLAQLNFSKLPNLKDYPTSGLLQFFIDINDDLLGMPYRSTDKPGFAVVYHKFPLTKNIETNIPVTSFNRTTHSYLMEGVYYPDAKIDEIGINVQCDEFWDELIKFSNKNYGTSYKRMGDIPSELSDTCWKICNDEADGCRIGGYPYFTQNDPRYDHPKYTQLLLQIDSENGIEWGDLGIANFFITPSDLKAKKFNDVLYPWDCY